MSDSNEEGVSIVDLVGEARRAAMAALEVLLGDIDEVLCMPETLAILQSLPPQLVSPVGIAIVADAAEQLGITQDNGVLVEDITDLIAIDKVVAANIATATNIVMEQLQAQQMHQQQAQTKLRSGLLAAN